MRRVSDAGDAILLDALDPDEGWGPAGIVQVTRRDASACRALVRRGLLESAEHHRIHPPDDWDMPREADGLVSVSAPNRYALTARGWLTAKRLKFEREHGPIRTSGEEWARWPGARACGACGCTPPRPCGIRLVDDKGSGNCVPAGVYLPHLCTACVAKEAA